MVLLLLHGPFSKSSPKLQVYLNGFNMAKCQIHHWKPLILVGGNQNSSSSRKFAKQVAYLSGGGVGRKGKKKRKKKECGNTGLWFVECPFEKQIKTSPYWKHLPENGP